MKLLITWFKNSGKCRSWTNARESEHCAMAGAALHEATKRIAVASDVSYDYAKKRIFDAMELIEDV